MSAWYVMSALGLYCIAPGSSRYQLGSPLFEEASVRLGESGRVLRVVARGNSAANVYVERVTWEGRPLEGLEIEHEQIAAGGTLEFFMSSNSTEA